MIKQVDETILDEKAKTEIGSDVVRFWGKNINDHELAICKSLGWVECEKGEKSVWRLAGDACSFPSSIYSGDALRKFYFDRYVYKLLIRQQLVCLDEFFGENSSDRDFHLCVILNLVDYFLEGLVGLCVTEELLIFYDPALLLKLRSVNKDRSEIQDDIIHFESDEIVARLVRKGLYCATVEPDGIMLLSETPKKLLGSLSDEMASEPPLSEIITELERRGMMRRRKVPNGGHEWCPTRKGRRAGLAATDVSVLEVFERLGFGTVVERLIELRRDARGITLH